MKLGGTKYATGLRNIILDGNNVDYLKTIFPPEIELKNASLKRLENPKRVEAYNSNIEYIDFFNNYKGKLSDEWDESTNYNKNMVCLKDSTVKEIDLDDAVLGFLDISNSKVGTIGSHYASCLNDCSIHNSKIKSFVNYRGSKTHGLSVVNSSLDKVELKKDTKMHILKLINSEVGELKIGDNAELVWLDVKGKKPNIDENSLDKIKSYRLDNLVLNNYL